MPRLQEITQILPIFKGDQLLHKRNNRKHLARVAEKAEAEQVSLPQAAQVSIIVDTPSPSLRIKEKPQALLRNRTDHIETIGLKLRVTRGDSFRRRCFTTLPLSHIRAVIVRRFGAARRFLAVGSAVGIRPP